MSKWGSLKIIGKVALAIASAAVPAIGEVEKRAEDVVHLKGKDKQDAALALVKQSLALSEDITGKDLLNDPAVEAATRGVIDAIVALHNVTAKAIVAPSSAAALHAPAGSIGD